MSKYAVLSSTTRMTPIAAAIHLVFAGALAASGAAFAQESTAPVKEATLQEIKVIETAETGYAAKATSSATRTDTLLRDVPQAITVVTKQMMRDQNMQSMGDALRYVPGIVTAQGEGNRDAAVFRGNSSTSDFYVDGIRDDVQYFRDFYNIESVEFLKGSNAMAFGRGGSGGVINRVTKQPLWTPVREGSLTIGSYKNRRATADVGQAIDADLAFRVNALVENSGSYRDGVRIERKGINPTLALRAGPNTSLVLGYEYFSDERVADRGIPSQGSGPFRTDPSTFFGNPELSRADVLLHAFTSVLDHDFGNGVSVRNRTRLADYDKFYQNVYASSPVAADGTLRLGAYNNTTLRRNLFNQTDVFFSLNTGAIKHKLVAGMEFGHQENDNLRKTGRVNNSTTIVVPAAAPFVTSPVVFANLPGNADNHTDATVASVYLQDQIEFTPQWHAVAGLRYDRFNTKFYNKSNSTMLETTDTEFSPRLGLIYKPAETVSLYGSYSIAFVPRAGEQLASLSASNKALEAEEFENIELGAKWDVTPDLSLSAAVYRLERGNMAVTDPLFPTQAFLADGQTSKGVELGLTGKLTPQWSVMGGYAYQDAALERSSTFPALTGATLPMVPRHTLSLWNRYDFNAQLGAALGVSYRDSIYASIDNKVSLPDYTRVDAALFYQLSRQFQVQLNVENVLDREYYVSAHNNNNITPGSPRAFRVTLNAKF